MRSGLSRIGVRGALFSTIAVHLLIFTLSGRWFDQPTPFANDNVNLLLPYRVLLWRTLESGGLPFWDLYSAGGMPLFSVYSASFLNPLVSLLSLLHLGPSSSLLFEVFFYSILGLVGMWVWIGNDVPLGARGVLSIAWANSFAIVGHLHLNLEIAVSTLLFPWLLMGMMGFRDQRSIRMAITALSLTCMLTTGYLGIGPFILYALIVYVPICLYAEHRASLNSRVLSVNSTVVLRVLRDYAVVVGLVVAALSLSISETMVNLSRDVFFERALNPFQISTDWRTIGSIVTTDSSNVYSSFDNGGYVGSIFLPVFALAGLAWGAFRGGTRYWASVFAGMFVFAISLSPSVPWAVFVVETLPFLEDVRFHGFSLGIVLFFLITAASEGFRGGYPRGCLFIVAFTILLVMLASVTLAVDRTMFDKKGVVLLLACSGLVLLVASSRFSSSARSWTVGLLAIVSLYQVRIASEAWPISLIEQNREARQLSLSAIDRGISHSNQTVPQERTLKFEDMSIYGNMLNSHLVAGVPSLDTYSPHILPSMQAVIDEWKDERVERFRRFIFKSDYGPVAYEVLAFSADRAMFRVPQESSDQWLTVTTPYSRGWSAGSSDSDRLEIRPSRDQFLEVFVPAGTQTITIEYEPLYLWLLAPLTALSWIGMLTLLVIGVHRHRIAKNVNYKEPTN
jgi:hypothetical protein